MAVHITSASIGPATSRALLSRMRKGSEAAWAAGLRQYTELAFGCLTRFGLGKQEAEDVWQEAWLRVWRHLPEFDASRGRFRSWLLQIMRNQARDWKRRLRARSRDERLTDSYDAPVSADDPDGPSRWDELEGKSLESLQERCRNVAKELRALLRDYPSPDHIEPYLDWFFNGAPAVKASGKRAARGGRATKPDHDTNETIMKTAAEKTTLPWTANELESLRARLIASKRLLDAFPVSLPGPCLLRRAPRQGDDAVEALPLSGEVVVGRKGDPPLAFPEDRVLSGRHFRILVGPQGRCYAEDLSSRNGLWINGRRMREPRRLVHGDQLHAGNQDFVFHAGPATEWAVEQDD